MLMTLLRTTLFGSACLTVLSSHAAAQTVDDGAAVFAAAGVHRLWDDESSIGTGLSAGGGISFPLTDRWVIRGRVVRSHNKRDFQNGVIFQADATRYTGEILWKFSGGPRAGYVGGGAGGFAYDQESIFGPNPQDPRGDSRPVQRFMSSGNGFMYGAIAGLTAVAKGRFSLQPEISLWVGGDYHLVIEPAVIAAWRW